MKPEDVIPTYEEHGAAWARDRTRNLFEKPWLDRMLNAAPRAEGAVRILDLGCGAGDPIATYLAERGAQITGIDASKTLTGLFAQNLPDAMVVRADMRQLALDRAFDAILAWDSFFHLSAHDQRAMFAVFKAHAAPRAALMFTSGHVAGEAIGQVAGAPIYHASLSADEYRDLLYSHGFRVLHHKAEDPDCGGHTIWLAQYQSA
ncbi:class I SAM-dependent methyltransferase [Cognatiyoonia sp. IB215182]|uniref:class I SAM-dependent methyltransferase n=1 Tax=Cognatiyoonia sp. IB215182 TaxID=3097353 RepID=UPI002A115E16|nr:class I SAM-dependent methyltransferase [Cognatiyoonia sp. IB215182]MDX8353333.1 class I SAM-dependent methyltransferase [Cognatiyoonia sp. IB215182]